MATTTAATATDIQTLYVAYFNRPADPLGLQVLLNSGASLQTLANGFSASDEYKATYAGKTTLDLVDSIYMNLFGRHAESAGLLFWAARLQSGTDTFASIVLTIASNAQDDGTNNDLTAITSKVAAASAFTTSLDTAAEIRGYDGAAANAVAKAWLAGVTNATNLATATAPAALQAVADAAAAAHDGTINNPQSLVLTTGVDTIVGGAGNDTITASNTSLASTTTLTGLDSIDGGAGKDTLVISDVAGNSSLDLSLITVKNVEVLNLTSTGSLAGSAADVSGWTGLTNANFSLKAQGVQTITAADTTAVTVSNTGGVTVVGGSSVNVTAGTASAAVLAALSALNTAIGAATSDADVTAALNTAVTAGAINATQRTALETALTVGTGGATPTGGEIGNAQTLITGYSTTLTANTAVNVVDNSALASATIKGGDVVNVTDGSDNADQLKTVSLNGNSGLATLSGKALTAVTVANTSQSTTILNGTASHAETVTVTNVKGGTIQDSVATTLNVVAATTKSSNVTFSAGAATKVNVAAGVDLSATLTTAAATSVAVTGAGKVTIQGTFGTATSTIDASGSTGGVTVSPTLAAGQNFIGGAGKDAISIGATTKAIALGAGDDTVTLTGALGTGSVDGGAGTDTVAGLAAVMAAIAPADAAKLSNFETFKVTDALGAGQSFDVSQVAGVVNFVAGNGVTAGVTTAAATNLGANATVTILGDGANNGTLNFGLKADTAADVVNLVLNHSFADNDDGSSTATLATTTLVASTAVETINVTSTGTSLLTAGLSTGSVADTITNTLVLTDNALVTLKISGDQALSFTAGAAMTKLATIDASANTAGVSINAAADTIAVTIKGTAKADIITSGTQGDTITGGGGNDLFKFGAGSSVIGTGKFDTITDFVANTYGLGTNHAAGIGADLSDATKVTGDVLSFAKVGTGAGGVIVDVFTSASDASTYLANHTGTANTVVAALDATNNNLYVDNTGDGVADFYIHLTGVTTINAAAFTVV